MADSGYQVELWTSQEGGCADVVVLCSKYREVSVAFRKEMESGIVSGVGGDEEEGGWLSC